LWPGRPTPPLAPTLFERLERHKTPFRNIPREDPAVISEWFALVRNTKAKYGIVDDDIYNFDETGFMMGIIFAGMVVMTSDGRSKAKLAQPGNREWATVIQGVNALGWAIPPFIILAAQYHLANWYTEPWLKCTVTRAVLSVAEHNQLTVSRHFRTP
jgi:hypothetical protein